MIYYIRDDNNHLIGFRYRPRMDEETYYYVKNVEEDIIGILDHDYNTIVTYEYAAWGKIVSVKDSNNNEITDQSHIAIINPFRYRSYYYDEETKLYYLNSRYYNPNFGRFMNADGTIGANDDVISHNLFAYCSNNPINSTDLEGNFAFVLPLGIAFAKGTAAAVGLLATGTAGILGLGYVGTKEIEKTKPKTKTQTKTLTQTESVVYKKNETRIYRKGTTNYQLTPRPDSDEDGLSFYTYPNLKSGNYTVTTVEAINATQVLVALPEIKNPDHYLINPRFETIDNWIATKDFANITPHPYITLLKSISWTEKIK